MQVAYNAGRDTMAIYRYDPSAKKVGELIAEHPRFDIGADAAGDRVPGVIRDWKSDNIVGYAVAADKPEVVWTDESYSRLQRMLDAALPGTINRFTRTPDGKRLVVRVFFGHGAQQVVYVGRRQEDARRTVRCAAMDQARANG